MTTSSTANATTHQVSTAFPVTGSKDRVMAPIDDQTFVPFQQRQPARADFLLEQRCQARKAIGAGIEEHDALRAQPGSKQAQDFAVAEALPRLACAAELAQVKQGHDVKDRQRLSAQAVDVGEQNLVVLAQRRVADDMLYVCRMLVGR